MSITRAIHIKGAIIVVMGAATILTTPRAAAARSSTCYRTCIDAIEATTNCQFPMYPDCQTDALNCDDWPNIYVGYCNGNS